MRIPRFWKSDETTEELFEQLERAVRQLDGVRARVSDDDGGSIELTINGETYALELVEVR